MNDDFVNVRDLRTICREAPSQARVMFWGEDEGWLAVQELDPRFDFDKHELLLVSDPTSDKNFVWASEIYEDEQIKELRPESPVKRFVEYDWNDGEYVSCSEIWYEDIDDTIYLK